MKTKRFTILICVVAVAVLTVFAATRAMAFNDEQCIGLKYDDGCAPPLMTQTVGIWTITLSEPTQREDGYYDWNYTIRNPGGTITGSNFVAFLIPDCCKSTDKINIYPALSVPANLSEYPVGSGEPTIYFGRYNQQAFVIKGTPDSTGNWKLVSSSKHKTRSTIIIKSGKDVFAFEMAAPGCPILEPTGGRTHSECINTGQETTTPFSVPGVEGTFPAESDDVSFYIVRNMDRDGCIASVWACTGLYCPDCANEFCPTGEGYACQLLDQYYPELGTILEASLLRSCPNENFSVKTGSPYYKYTWNSGGITYVKCLDLGTYKWVANSYCGF